MKEVFQEFKKGAMLNSGQPILKVTKREVIFDPKSTDHLEAARVLFWPETEEDKKIKENLEIKFKLEPNFTSVRSMVEAKIVAWVLEIHKRGLRKASVLRIPTRHSG